MRVLVCVFLWVKSQDSTTTEPVNKFRAPLGNRGLVLGLNVPYFFRSLGTPMEHVQSKLDQAEVADSVTKNGMPILDTSVPAVFLLLFFLFFYSCSR